MFACDKNLTNIKTNCVFKYIYRMHTLILNRIKWFR